MEKYTPFGFYRKFLEEDIYNELEKFWFMLTEIDIIEHSFVDDKLIIHGEFTKIDKENNRIEYTECGEDKVHSLEGEVEKNLSLSAEIERTNRYIESSYEKLFLESKKTESFSNYLISNYNFLINSKAYNEFSFLKKYFDRIKNTISLYSESSIDVNNQTNVKSNNLFYSFTLLSENESEQDNILTNLHNQLTTQSIIECSKQDFFNAFTGKEVTKGIKWLVLAKNKQTSKVSLFYFLDKLIEKGFIARGVINDLNKYVNYIFRDGEGNPLKNIKQSKSQTSKNPASKNKIDEILSSL